MKSLKFRNLTADDVECRVCNTTDKKINLLIYKNARVDMAILNDTVGMGWQREHNFKDGKNYCTVSIWDDDNKLWVSREDCGVESNTEAEKGQSSDAFKRACFCWGIGTELYTGPKISIDKQSSDEYNGKICMTFSVKELEVNNSKRITHIVIVDRWGNERFRWSDNTSEEDEEFGAKVEPKQQESLSVEECKAIITECEKSAKESGKYDVKEVGKWAYGKTKWIEENNGFTGDFKSWLRNNFRAKFAS